MQWTSENPFFSSACFEYNSNFNQMRLQCQYLLGTYGDHKVLYHSPLATRQCPPGCPKSNQRGIEERKGCCIKLPTMGKANSQAHIKSDKIFITLWPHIIGLRPSSLPARVELELEPAASELPLLPHSAGAQCAADDVECATQCAAAVDDAYCATLTVKKESTRGGDGGGAGAQRVGGI